MGVAQSHNEASGERGHHHNHHNHTNVLSTQSQHSAISPTSASTTPLHDSFASSETTVADNTQLVAPKPVDGGDDKNVSPASPTPSGRQKGPSLLSQAIAFARGIPTRPFSRKEPTPTPTPALNNNNTTSAEPDREPETNLPASAPTTVDPRDVPPRPVQDDTLNPLVASQPLPMATPATMTAAPVPRHEPASVPSSFTQSDLTHVRDLMLEQRDAADKQTYRPSLSMDIIRKGTPPHEQNQSPTYCSSPEDATTPTRTSYLAESLPTQLAEEGNVAVEDAQTPSRPKASDKPTTGAEKMEKIWSIGAGEGSEEDGQVEKSVAEAMAGVEHNARSRKASYSLRFFKEGLPPDDKVRRRDTKVSGREKLGTTAEEVDSNGPITPSDDGRQLSAAPQDDDVAAPRPGLPQTTSHTSITSERATREIKSDAGNRDEKDDDMARLQKEKPPLHSQSVGGDHHDEINSSAPASTSPQHTEVGPTPCPDERPPSVEGRRGSDDSTEVGDSHDELDADAEADESGEEEKISSAVFVPHKDKNEVRNREEDLGSRQDGQRPRSPSHSEQRDWLVKADEPEPEIHEDDENRSRLSRLHSIESLVSVRSDLGREPANEDAIVDEYEVTPVHPQPPPVAEEFVHDHEDAVAEPLSTIELIPYKHQVGGHTTLWRFSRRAVCKQLNNRENEFYETIEIHHRDLLPFLPRYVLVCT